MCTFFGLCYQAGERLNVGFNSTGWLERIGVRLAATIVYRGGVISATTLIGLHYLVAFLTLRSKRLEEWIEGTPRTLIHNGVLDEAVMLSEFLTRHELAGALRAAGCSEIEHVRIATLENNGQITVSLRNHDSVV